MDALRKNHFDLLGLKPAFSIDEALLARAYRELQLAVHPDRFAAGTPLERRLAMQLSAQANEAHRCLRDPVSRAAYLCQLAGVAIDEHTNTAMPVEFLQEQMSWRESLEDSRVARDVSGLRALAARIDAERSLRIATLQCLLDEKNDARAASSEVRQLMFVDRFAEQIHEALDALA
jgi:molecular chaperone HscB